MRRARWFIVPALALALIAAACGDDNESSTSTATTAGGGTGTTAAGGGDSCKFDKSMKIIALVEKPPEGPNAIPDFDEGFQLALDDIGGTVCGQKLEYSRIPASPTDGNQAKNAYLQALDQKPTINVGIPSGTPILSVAPEVAKAQIPFIYFSVTPQAFVGAANGVGSEWGFILRPRNTGIAQIQVDYITKDLGKKNIGLLCANIAFGTQGCDAAAKAIEANGAKVVGREVNETTDTDLTAKVIALKNKNPDGILAFTFPNNLAVFYNQAADNGLNVPIFGGSSAGLIVGTVKSNARANVWGTDDCVPASDAATKDWVAKYEKKFNKKMSGSGYAIAEAYDSIGMAVQAAKTANSLDPKKIADQLRSQTYKGICETYKADPGQGLHHTTHVVQFDANGIAQSKKKLEVPAS